MNDRIKHDQRHQCANLESAAAAVEMIQRVKDYYGYSERKVAPLIGISRRTIQDARKGLITLKTVNSIRAYWRGVPTSDKKKMSK